MGDVVQWRKSRRSSDPEIAACVELANLCNGKRGIRDSKNPDDGYIEVTPAQLRKIFEEVINGY